MEKTQVFALLKTLSASEIRRFRKFLDSPFFNHRQDVLKVFQYLISKIQKGKNTITREKVFLKVYGDQKFEEQMFRQLLSWLQQLIEKFLTYEAMMSDEVAVKLKLTTIFRERNLPKHFQKTIKSADQLIEDIPFRNADFYEKKFQLENEKYLATAGKRMSTRNFESLSKNLDDAYIIKKLQQACLSVAHQTVYKFDLDLGMFQKVLDYIEKRELDKNLTIASYLYCYKMLLKSEREDFFIKFKIFLFQNEKRFAIHELRDLYLLAINFCIRQLNNGKIRFAEEGLNLYKNSLQSEVLFFNGKLSRFTFQNIVAMGLKVKEYDWVEEFIKKYKSQLRKDFQESAFALNMAQLEYHRNNRSQVLTLLQRADYKDLLMNLSAKTLAAKTYFELDEKELLEAHLQTMQVFIQRKKIMGYHRKNYLNFIQFLQKIIRLPNFEKEKRNKLLEKIRKAEFLTEKKWLLEKMT